MPSCIYDLKLTCAWLVFRVRDSCVHVPRDYIGLVVGLIASCM